MDTKMIGSFLKELRKENNMTQEKLGERIGVTNKTVSRWETGNYMPRLQHLDPAVFADHQNAAGVFAKQVIHCLFIFCDSILPDKCLNGSGEASSMDTADAAASENCLADGKGQRHILGLNVLSGVNVLQIFEGRISGSSNGPEECRDIFPV